MAVCDTYSEETLPTKVRKEPTCGTGWIAPSDSPACVQIDGGDFLSVEQDADVYETMGNTAANETWDTNLATTQQNFKESFLGVSLSHYHCDACFPNHECGVRYAPKESACGFLAEYTIVDAAGDALPSIYFKGQMYAAAKVSGSNLLHANNVVATTNAAIAIVKAAEDSGTTAKSTVVVEFV